MPISEKIAGISREFGAEVPFKRPSAISADVATELVLQHAVKYLEDVEKYKVDGVVLLQPTSPLRKSETIAKCVKKLSSIKNADSVITVNNVEGFRPEWMLYLRDGNRVVPYNTPFIEDGKPIIKLVARQSFPVLYKQNGVVYVARRDLLMKKCQIIGAKSYAVVIDEGEALDIDTETDFFVIESLMRIKEGDPGHGIASGKSAGLSGSKVKLIVYDFDGVMTDNKALVDQDGNECVFVNRSDGLAISKLKEMGIEQLIISAEKNPIVKKRAQKLGLACINAASDKKTVLKKYLEDKKINRKNVIFVGNDYNDLDAMKHVGYPVAPADACREVKDIAKIVTVASGGRGVIRELLDIIVKSGT